MPGAVFGLSISQMLSDLGYAGLTLLMVAETVFPPIPSEVVLPLAGYLVQKGDFEFVPALIASTLGSLIGAVLLEEAARHGGRPFADRFLRFARQDRQDSTKLRTGSGDVARSWSFWAAAFLACEVSSPSRPGSYGCLGAGTSS